jgi:hypothetical protein
VFVGFEALVVAEADAGGAGHGFLGEVAGAAGDPQPGP